MKFLSIFRTFVSVTGGLSIGTFATSCMSGVPSSRCTVLSAPSMRESWLFTPLFSSMRSSFFRTSSATRVTEVRRAPVSAVFSTRSRPRYVFTYSVIFP